MRHALVPHANGLARLRALGNVERGIAEDRWHGYCRAQRRLRNVDVLCVQDVVTLAPEKLVGPDANYYVQVSRSAAVASRFAFAPEPHLRAVLDARGNRHFDLSISAFGPAAPARLAGPADYASFTTAYGAGDDLNELAEHALVCAAHLSAAPAIGAGGRGAAGLASAALAGGADLGPLKLYVLFGAEYGILEVDSHGVTYVGATPRAILPAACARPAEAAEERVKYVAEAAEVFVALEPSSGAVSR